VDSFKEALRDVRRDHQLFGHPGDRRLVGCHADCGHDYSIAFARLSRHMLCSPYDHVNEERRFLRVHVHTHPFDNPLGPASSLKEHDDILTRHETLRLHT
jgi:hypothetical protein